MPGPAVIPRSMLALVPQPELGITIHNVLHDAGLLYTVPIQITLATGLDSRLEDDWRGVVDSVLRHHAPFTVRMRGPEIIQDRTVCLRVVDQTTMLLRDSLNRSLRASGYLPDIQLTDDVLLALAGTWTDLNKVQVHELAAALRDALPNPVEFPAIAVYAFEESADDDLPRGEYLLKGGS
ncbi:MAG: hypothetical protein ACHQIG_00355 [Acidimicrobiia bacterium]